MSIPLGPRCALSLRLKELEREGLVSRRVESTQPVSVIYELTEKGCALEAAITALDRWAHDWVAPRASRPDTRAARSG